MMCAELEVQRTIKRSELFGPSTIHTDNMGIVDGLWWDEDVKHVKAHRTEKGEERSYVPNAGIRDEKADEQANEGADVDEVANGSGQSFFYNIEQLSNEVFSSIEYAAHRHARKDMNKIVLTEKAWWRFEKRAKTENTGRSGVMTWEESTSA